MELACLPRCIPWNLGRVAQLRLDESGLSDDERWVIEGPCSTVLSEKRQGLRTKTNKQVEELCYLRTYWVCTPYGVPLPSYITLYSV